MIFSNILKRCITLINTRRFAAECTQPRCYRCPMVLMSALVASAVTCTPDHDDEKHGSPSFRDRKVMEYENRIRTFSTPDKIFRYFSTVRVDDVVYMTVDDLYRAITPDVKQPKDCGLDRFRTISAEKAEVHVQKSDHVKSVFGEIFPRGLISFGDYLLMTALISIPLWHVEVCFNMMDLDGNGHISHSEFRKLEQLIIGRSSMGNRHRDTSHGTHTSATKGITCIERFLFGESLTGTVQLEEFVHFLSRLQQDMAQHEFRRLSHPHQDIPAERFATIFTHYTHISSPKRTRIMRRLKTHSPALNVSLEDYAHFVNLLSRIDDIVLILDFYDLADVPFDRKALKRLSRIVTGRELSHTMVEMLFTVLDEDDDGKLSNQEFLSLIRKSVSHGLDKPKDTQFMRTIAVMYNCAVEFRRHSP